jgi:predicted Zn-dependent peptidase
LELGQDKWVLASTTQAAQRPRVRSVPARDLERLAEEIAKAKAGYSQNVAQQRAQDSFLATRLQAHIDNGYNFLTWDKALEDRIMAVTPEQVSAAFRRHIDPARITYVKAGDFAKAAATGP